MCLGEQIAPSIYFLRKAWYAFSRLIDIPFEECFICPTCGPSPNVIVCDGTMVGMRKDLLPFKHKNQPQEDPVFPVIKGSAHVDRVLIKSKRVRDMLLKYSGYRRDRKPIACPQMVTIKEFDQLVKLLRSDGFSSLAQLLDKLEKKYHERTAPKPYRKFFSEIARNTPACGMVQIAGCKQTCSTLHAITKKSIDIFSPKHHRLWKDLSEKAPVITSFLMLCRKDLDGEISSEILDVLGHILTTLQAPFKLHPPDPSYYPQPDPTNCLSYFPSLPQLHGNAAYEKDKSRTAPETDKCRKRSSSHPTLTPGIFTVYCPHSVCYGFEMLTECESPCHPFQIFKTRFSKPPGMIIYDNACSLHQYCLNREPIFFQNTTFYVDRFHWRGHIGCSSGYCLDEYCTMDIKSINSQVNEQANSGLQRIKGQLAYMNYSNFIFHLKLFLAIKNMDICIKQKL